MLISFLAASVVFGLFISLVWGTSDVFNVLIKIAFSLYTVWAIILLIGAATPMVGASGLKLF